MKDNDNLKDQASKNKRKVILEVKNISKHFGGIRAVDGVDMKLYEGEIIAIVGDNGAGKSTLIKMISGVYKKDSGKIYINGEEAHIDNPIDARKYGIETVYQDQGLVQNFNASLNLFLGREKVFNNFFGKAFKMVDYRHMRKETKKMFDMVGVDIKDIFAEVEDFSGGQKQSVVVGRAVYWGGKILIFDEPTNNLGVKQERKIIELIKKIRKEYGLSIIIISHNIAHVFELVDRIIVLRNGRVVGEKIKDKTNTNEIISMITGVAVGSN
jgi:ABC-type sugar transport system ATPase subunit